MNAKDVMLELTEEQGLIIPLKKICEEARRKQTLTNKSTPKWTDRGLIQKLTQNFKGKK
jgi:hypothetical protein